MGAAFHAFNIGRDIQITITQQFPVQGLLFESADLGLLEDFTYRPTHRIVESIPINNGGVPVLRDTHQGWEGTILFTRANEVGDQIEQLIQDFFYKGAGTLLWTINCKILAPFSDTGQPIALTTPGSSEWIFHDCIIHMDDGGSYRTDDKITQRWTFRSPRRTAGAGAPSSAPNLAALLQGMQTLIAKLG